MLKGFSTHTEGIGQNSSILLFFYFFARLGPAKIIKKELEICVIFKKRYQKQGFPAHEFVDFHCVFQ